MRILPFLILLSCCAPGMSAQWEVPCVAVSYYPDVTGPIIDDDIAKMKDVGIGMVRFGEFAWIRMEPDEGRYDFSWMHQAVDRFAKAGIAVQLCTPTAAPPIWLTKAHPDILRVNDGGLAVGHGGRRQYCPNSPTYRRYAVQIAARLGAEFGTDPGVGSWQIDNEFWDDCYCASCETAFHAFLEKEYGTIAKLNAAWLTTLWSQEYQSFAQIPLPDPRRIRGSHHPSLRTAYRHFMSDSYVAFCNEQVAALRRRCAYPITTNGHNPVYQRIDYTDLFRGLDLVGTDSYAGPDALLRYAFECDWMRPLKKPFWLAETASTYSAGTSADAGGDFTKRPGALRAKMWLTYALGGDVVSFWHWRAHWAGQELEHGALLYQWGDECANTPEIRQVSRELKQHGAWLRATKPAPARVAMTYGLPSQWNYEASSMASGFNYDREITAFHHLLADGGITRDVIMPGASLEGYQTIFSPYFPAIPAADRDRLQRFVEQGGTWVLGPLSASRTTDATAFSDACYGKGFEHWLGLHVRHRMPPGPDAQLTTEQGMTRCTLWCDAYEVVPAERILARYAGGPLDGFAAIVQCPIGKGRVIMFGTRPDEGWMRGFISRLVPVAGIAADAGLVVAERVTSDGKPAGFIAVNTRSASGKITMPDGTTSVLAGYGVAIVPP